MTAVEAFLLWLEDSLPRVCGPLMASRSSRHGDMADAMTIVFIKTLVEAGKFRSIVDRSLKKGSVVISLAPRAIA